MLSINVNVTGQPLASTFQLGSKNDFNGGGDAVHRFTLVSVADDAPQPIEDLETVDALSH